MPQTSYINVNTDKLWGNDARAKFYSIHFPNKGRHNGHVVFKGQDWKMIRYVRSGTAVCNYAQHMFVRKQDYYTTINTFSGCTSDNEHLYGLTNIYADFDCTELHQSNRPLTTEQWTNLCKLFERVCGMIDNVYPDDLPMPNTVVCTGRGLGFWWAIDQISYKLLPIYEAVRNRLLTRFAEWLHDWGINEIQLDFSASKRPAGLARLPGTYNDTAKRWGFFSIVHEQRTDLLETAIDMGVGYVREKSVNNIITIPQGGVIAALVESNRVDMLYKLRDIRVANGTIAGKRDQMLYCLYNTLKRLNPNHEETVMRAVHEYNNSFGSYALPEHKVDIYMSSSRRKDYYLTDLDTIERVGLTELEAAMIGFTPSSYTPDMAFSCRQTAKVKRIAKAKRNEEIIARYKAGESQASIARDLGINRSTVNRIIKVMAEEVMEQTDPETPDENNNTTETERTHNKTINSKSVAKSDNENIFKHCSYGNDSGVRLFNSCLYSDEGLVGVRKSLRNNDRWLRDWHVSLDVDPQCYKFADITLHAVFLADMDDENDSS